MGFKTGAFAKVWEVTPVDDYKTKLKVSISRKDKNDSTKYIQDFTGFIICRGSLAAKKAASLRAGAGGSRIRIGSSDTTYFYDKDKGRGYTSHLVYSFYTEDDEMFNLSYKDFLVKLATESQSGSTKSGKKDYTSPQPVVDDGELDDSRLPF